MSLSAAVTAQFKLIVRNKCTSNAQWNVPCVFHLSTAVLGYFLIFLVALAQIPVLYKVLRYQQDTGLVSHLRIGLMAAMASNNVAYAVNHHLPISTWGEGVIQITQYLIIINILLIHQGRHSQAVAFTLFYVTIMVGYLAPVVPSMFLVALKLLNIPADIFSKSLLMYKCHKLGAPVDPVSSRCSIILLNLCSWGRLLTALAHSQDVLLIVAYGQESLSTLALTTVAMAARRKVMRKEEKDGGEVEDKGIGSDGEEFNDTDGKRKRKYSREEAEDGDTSSGADESIISYEKRMRRRRWRRSGRHGDSWSSSSSSGLDDVIMNSAERRLER